MLYVYTVSHVVGNEGNKRCVYNYKRRMNKSKGVTVASVLLWTTSSFTLVISLSVSFVLSELSPFARMWRSDSA
jgi:hypothetical protein